MSFTLTPEQWAQVHAYQAAEIERLAADAEHARRASLLDHYSRIGRWLTPERAGRALELGCGPGRYVAMLASLGYEVVGADPCPAASLPSWGIIGAHRAVEFRDGVYAESLPFADASFDAVACMGALLYFSDVPRALAEVRRVLRPGGRLVVRTVNRRNVYRLFTGRNMDPAAPNAYSPRELRALLAGAGFEVGETFTYGFNPPVLAGPWWHLVNGRMPLGAQALVSRATPAPLRSNVTVFCTRPADAPAASGPPAP